MTRIGNEWHRAKALAAVAEHLAGQPALLQQALGAAVGIGNGWDRARALAAVARTWSFRCDYLHFIQILDAMGEFQRRDWLELVQGFLSIITELGGKAAVGETVDAILDTACWWP